ncbi:MAG: hypothetical protein A3B92_03675 [Candidatus Harrisonbacteria bacterium RIFCSPHIGHO2_02_FULL_42_16]|uniref:Uncharacterized protein n=1 Tax=Candidatus Harrisonbacteria bacterium RIFCSPHIGHO2_02_FULL_42_16 TaxID=1798404 RepID=A0A1G1ZI05_9BACT|nr:MAG: hypothetical protein A3B92_03675 [Candidatus Harrisonbacteria bacterium RIFCSPHIGHO2_02_FULL_42_16]
MADWPRTVPDLNGDDWQRVEEMGVLLTVNKGGEIKVDIVKVSNLESGFRRMVGLATFFKNKKDSNLVAYDIFFLKNSESSLRFWTDKLTERSPENTGVALKIQDRWVPMLIKEKMFLSYKKYGDNRATMILSFVSGENFEDIRCLLRVEGERFDKEP